MATTLRSITTQILTKRISQQCLVRSQSGSHQSSGAGDTWAGLVMSSERLIGRPSSRLILESLFSEEREAVAGRLRHLLAADSTDDGLSSQQKLSLKFRELFILLMSVAWAKPEATNSTALKTYDSEIPKHTLPSHILEQIHLLAELSSVVRIGQKIHDKVNDKVQDKEQTLCISESSACSNSVGGSQSVSSVTHINPYIPFADDYNDQYLVSSPRLAQDEESSIEDSIRSRREVERKDVSTPTEVEDINYSSLILCGDFLMATVILRLASLRNPKILELIMQAVGDWSQSKFVIIEKCWNSEDKLAGLKKWQKKNTLAHANLLTSTCQSSLILAGDNNEQTFEWVGKICLHVALALQARKDLEPFQDEAKIKNLTEEDFMSLLPVILHTTQDDDLETAAFSDKQTERVQEVVRCGAGVAGCLQILEEHKQEALLLLQKASGSQARSLLHQLIDRI